MQISEGEIRPGETLGAPLYVKLKKNEKLVCLRGPLDSLSDEELKRFLNQGVLYSHPYWKRMVELRETGRALRKRLLEKREFQTADGGRVQFSIPPFVLSRIIFDHLRSLWIWNPEDECWETEPIFGAVLWTALEPGYTYQGLDLLHSSWCAVVGLFLGMTHLETLRSLSVLQVRPDLSSWRGQVQQLVQSWIIEEEQPLLRPQEQEGVKCSSWFIDRMRFLSQEDESIPLSYGEEGYRSA